MDINTYENFHLEEIKKLYQSVGWTNYLERTDILEEAYQAYEELYRQIDEMAGETSCEAFR